MRSMNCKRIAALLLPAAIWLGVPALSAAEAAPAAEQVYRLPIGQVKLSELPVPPVVRLVDPKASEETGKLYAYLNGLRASKYLLYGQQIKEPEDAARWGKQRKQGVVQDDPAIVMLDLHVFGKLLHEKQVNGGKKPLTFFQAEKKAKAELMHYAAAWNEREILQGISVNPPNSALVQEKGKVNETWDYSEDTSHVLTEGLVPRILPGGDLNPVFTGYLDLAADYAQMLQEKGIPVVFYPYPESSSEHVWWGKTGCSDAEFRNLYRYTVEYMRDVRQAHNLLYVYTPGKDAEGGAIDPRYPGDAFVDLQELPMILYPGDSGRMVATSEYQLLSASRAANYRGLKVTRKDAAPQYGYFLTPAVTDIRPSTKLRAKVAGSPREVRFVAYDTEGQPVCEKRGMEDADRIYYAVFTKADLKPIGAVKGRIDLLADGICMDSLQVSFWPTVK